MKFDRRDALLVVAVTIVTAPILYVLISYFSDPSLYQPDVR